MIVGILQPGYLPWLGFFEQLYRSHVFVLYDDVPYDKNGWRNRNRIKTASGAQWLTVPVRASLSERTLVRDAEIDNARNWRRSHLRSIEQSYSKAPFFERYISGLREVYESDWDLIADLDERLIRMIAAWLGMGDKRIVRSSDLGVTGGRIDRLVALCGKVGADTLYEGSAGRNYIDVAEFRQNGIEVIFQDYVHPTYSQLHGEFIPFLSVIDLLFMHGDGSMPILSGESTQGAH
ncbi:hypothetical protein EG829_25270 [bacterium]|nr:hypothetical protein [bacterium]